MKNINEMELDELKKEMSELQTRLYMARTTGTYDQFNWNGLDYWDAERRHYRISQMVFLKTPSEKIKEDNRYCGC